MPTLSASLLPVIAAAVAQATDGVVITTAAIDPPGPAIVYVNPAFCALTGYTPDELLGRNPRLLQGPDSDRRELGFVRAALEAGQSYRGEIINYRKDGQAYMLRWHLDPVHDAGGTITHWIAIQRDVTAQRAARAERAALLRTAEEALALRDQFLAIAAHELRTPLTALLGYAHLVPRAAEQGADAVAALTERLVRQGTRLTALIEQLLDVTHLQQGQFSVDLVPLDLAALTAQVVGELRQTSALDGSQPIMLHVPDGTLMVAGDAARLEEVLTNLVGNARKYSPEDSAVTVRVGQADDAVWVEVQDQGIGIPADALPHLFKPYFRVGGSGPGPRGFGLGLYVVHQIVQRHHGQIAVDSTPGVGSTFRLTLPRVAAAP